MKRISDLKVGDAVVEYRMDTFYDYKKFKPVERRIKQRAWKYITTDDGRKFVINGLYNESDYTSLFIGDMQQFKTYWDDRQKANAVRMRIVDAFRRADYKTMLAIENILTIS